MLIQSEFVDLNTPTGIMRTYVHKPVTAKKTPAILFYSEIFQQTGPIERAAKIIAGHGFTVLVPEVFHELNPIGTVLAYDDAGRDKGNADKSAKDVEGYDTDNQAMIAWVKKQPWFSGHMGAMGFRKTVYEKMLDAKLKFTWHEFNGQHAFMRDEGERYDPELAFLGYELALKLFQRKLT